MNRTSRIERSARCRIVAVTIICFSLFPSVTAIAQEAIYQRTFPVSVSDVNTALLKIAATSKGRLPTLDGFVQQADRPIERYDKGYFECSFQILPGLGAETLVQAKAKITAWYTDPDGAQSGYRVLISNGHLEGDVLDRIAEALTLQPTGATRNGVNTPVPGSPPAGSLRSTQGGIRSPGGSTHFEGSSESSRFVPAEPASVPSAGVEPEKALRAIQEKKSAQLTNYVHDLEEIQRNQSHPTDLAAVSQPRTPIFVRPSETARVIMNADAHDEFQVLGVDGLWVHVQISGASRGWIRRKQLEMPSGFSQTEAVPARNLSAVELTFKLVKEETVPFRGSWQPLKGRPVRIEWVEPANPATSTSPKEKLAYAKSTLLRVSQLLAQSHQTAEGIVVVFDSADGGQIAAPLASVKELSNRTLSEAAFWKECSLDPRESFLDPAKP